MESRRPDDGIIKLIPGRFSADVEERPVGGWGMCVCVGGGLSGATVASPGELMVLGVEDRVAEALGEQRERRRPR